RLPLFPLSSGLFPDGLLALRIFEIRYLDMIKRCLREKTPFVVVRLLEGREVDSPAETVSFEAVGCLAECLEVDAITPALLTVRAAGTHRVQVQGLEKGRYGLWSGDVTQLPDDTSVPIPADCTHAVDSLGQLIADLQRQGVAPEQMPILAPYRLDEAGWVANRWAEILPFGPGQKQALLLEDDPVARLQTVCRWMGGLRGPT
ncbi:MAG: hypothetical protein RIR28_795, partial [Pseudomonadota bacterium]